MKINLVELEKEGRSLKLQENYVEARKRFELILQDQPDYEKGFLHYELGTICDALNDFGSAKKYYQMAYDFNPSDPMFVAAYEDFTEASLQINMKNKYGITPLGMFLGWIVIITILSFFVLKGFSYFAKSFHSNPNPQNKIESSTQVEPSVK